LPRFSGAANRARHQSVILIRIQSIFIQEISMSAITRHDSDARLSRAVIHNGVVYLAGLTADKRSAGMKEQTTEILNKIDVLLKKSGTDKSKLLSAMIWITDMRMKPAMDEAWLEWADAKNLPARACVETRLGTPDTLVEIMVVAAQ
jgi:enamine deaminase RidA (YjgF/YER057c/UK114 family)